MNIINSFRSIRNHLTHAINEFLGYEEKVTENGQTYYTCTEKGRAHALAKEQKMAAKAAAKEQKAATKAAKVSSTPVTICQTAPLRVRMCNGALSALSIVFPVALLVIRSIVPEVAEALPNTYQFLDTVIIPMIEWLYAAALNGVEALMQQEWFQEILQFLASFAA